MNKTARAKKNIRQTRRRSRPNNRKSYSLFLGPEKWIEEKSTYDFVYLASVTKFIVLLGFLDCIRRHHVRVKSNVKKVFPEFEHDYTFEDIINHRTNLSNDWIGSVLHNNYSKSQDIYDFTLHLPLGKEKGDKPKIRYNNYAYDILAYAVYKLEGKYIDKYLEGNLLRKVKYKWYGRGQQKYGGHGLCIHTSTARAFAQNVVDAIQRHRNVPWFWMLS